MKIDCIQYCYNFIKNVKDTYYKKDSDKPFFNWGTFFRDKNNNYYK